MCRDFALDPALEGAQLVVDLCCELVATRAGALGKSQKHMVQDLADHLAHAKLGLLEDGPWARR
jgi:hypothetical protein